jgi:hypothetical protein
MRLFATVLAVPLAAALFAPAARAQASIPYRRTIDYIPSRPSEATGRYARVNVSAPVRQSAAPFGRPGTALGLETTVNVPDGGAVLAGGYSSASDGRNEFGVPGAAGIPGRALRNVGYGRRLRNTSVSVHARVIILAEEEERQTGVRP